MTLIELTMQAKRHKIVPIQTCWLRQEIRCARLSWPIPSVGPKLNRTIGKWKIADAIVCEIGNAFFRVSLSMQTAFDWITLNCALHPASNIDANVAFCARASSTEHIASLAYELMREIYGFLRANEFNAFWLCSTAKPPKQNTRSPPAPGNRYRARSSDHSRLRLRSIVIHSLTATAEIISISIAVTVHKLVKLPPFLCFGPNTLLFGTITRLFHPNVADSFDHLDNITHFLAQ